MTRILALICRRFPSRPQLRSWRRAPSTHCGVEVDNSRLALLLGATMTKQLFPTLQSHHKRLVGFALLAAALLCAEAGAALVLHQTPSVPNPTPLDDVMDGQFFSNDATTGGGDINKITTTALAARDFSMNGLGGPTAVSGVITFQSFAFATGGAASDNDASSLTLTFTYLGNDEMFGGGDDVLIGSTESFGYNTVDPTTGWNGAGLYYVNFSSDPSATITGLGNRFRVEITPSDLPTASSGVRFKTTSGTGIGAAKFSFSGTFAAIPEPSSMLVLGTLGTIAALTKRR